MNSQNLFDIHPRNFGVDTREIDCLKMAHDFEVPLFMVKQAVREGEIVEKKCPAQSTQEISDILSRAPPNSEEELFAHLRWDEISDQMLQQCNSYEQAIAVFQSARPHSKPQLAAIQKASALFFLDRPPQGRQWNVPEYQLREALGQPITQCPAQTARQAREIYLSPEVSALKKDIALARWRQLYQSPSLFETGRQNSKRSLDLDKEAEKIRKKRWATYHYCLPPILDMQLDFLGFCSYFYRINCDNADSSCYDPE